MNESELFAEYGSYERVEWTSDGVVAHMPDCDVISHRSRINKYANGCIVPVIESFFTKLLVSTPFQNNDTTL